MAYPSDLGERLMKRGATRSDVQALLCDTSLHLEIVEGAEITPIVADSTLV